MRVTRLVLFTVLAVPGPAAAADLAVTPAQDLRYSDVTDFHNAEQAKAKAANPSYKPVPHEGVTAYVACERYEVLALPRIGSKPSTSAGLADVSRHFLERVTLLIDNYQGEGSRYSLIAIGETRNAATLKILGWVRTDYVISTNVCLRDKHKIHRKAMVVNSLAMLQSKANPNGAKPDDDEILLPPPYIFNPDRPKDIEDSKRFKFLDVFFVWADTNSGNDQEGHVLLGKAPEFNPLLSVKNPLESGAMIHGWVDKKRIAPWNTREGFRWNVELKDRPLVQTYNSVDEARAFGQGQTPPRSQPSIDETFVDGKPLEWPVTRMCYPRLPFFFNGRTYQNIKFPKNPPPVKLPDPDTDLYCIGVVGGLFNNNVMTLTADQRTQVLKEIAQFEAQLNTTEIVFVIDRTASMEDWFRSTSLAVRKILESVGRDPGHRLRVAFCYYADLNDGEATLAQAKDAGRIQLTSFYEHLEPDGRTRGRGLEAELKILDEVSRKEDGNRKHQAWLSGDVPEMMFAGLEQGLDAGWLKNSYARRMVVLIGDDGDHLTDAKGVHAKQEKFKSLLKSQTLTPIDFYVMHFGRNVGVAVPGQVNWATIFKEQTNGLVRLLQDDKEYTGTAEYYSFKVELGNKEVNEQSEKEFVEIIMARYAKLREGAEKLKKLLEQKVHRGHAADISDPKLKAQFEAWAKSLAKRMDLKDPTDLMAGAQAFDRRFVWEHNPRDITKKQIRKMVYVSGADLQDVVGLLERLFNKQRPTTTLADLRSEVTKFLAGQGHVPGINEVEDYSQGLSFIKQLHELKEADRDRFAKMILELQKKYYRLRNIQATNGRVIDVKWELRGGKEEAVESAPRLIRPDEVRKMPDIGGITFYWIDLEEEWP